MKEFLVTVGLFGVVLSLMDLPIWLEPGVNPSLTFRIVWTVVSAFMVLLGLVGTARLVIEYRGRKR